jgi:hypothetical protein
MVAAGWWATPVRMLALVLALVVSLTVTSLAGAAMTELAVSLGAAPNKLGAKDPGLIVDQHRSGSHQG